MKHIRIRTWTVAIAVAITVLGSTWVVRAAQKTDKIDVTGKWAFTVETSAGSGTPTFNFKQDGEKLTGQYSGQLGEAELTGTVKGNAISFTFAGDVQGNKIDAAYAGTVESKDTMKGTVKLAGLGEGTFTGKRQ
jgi:hypothetical protein